MGISVADIVADFGAVYENNGQNQSRLLEQLRKPVEFQELMTPVTTTETTWKAAETTITSLLQPFQKGWTPKGDAAFTPIEHILRKAKVDFEMEPDDISFSWAGFLEGKSENERANWPISRWLLEQKIIPQLMEDKELQALFHGVYAAPTPGTPGNAADIIDGINQQRKTANAAGRLGTIAVGAPPTTAEAYVDYILDFAKQIDSQYRRRGMTIAIPKENELLYREGFRIKYGANTSTNENDNLRVLDLPFNVKGYDAMAGSDVIFATPKENLKLIRKAASNATNFKIESLKRQVYIYTHFYMCIGIDIPEVFFTNDVELI